MNKLVARCIADLGVIPMRFVALLSLNMEVKVQDIRHTGATEATASHPQALATNSYIHLHLTGNFKPIAGTCSPASSPNHETRHAC